MTIPPSLLLLSVFALHPWSTLGAPQRRSATDLTSVSCKVTAAWGTRIVFQEQRTPYTAQVVLAVTAREGILTLPVTQSSGAGYLQTPGSPLLKAEWRDGQCVNVEEPPPREVCGRVANAMRLQNVSVLGGGVGAAARTTIGGRFCALVPSDSSLQVHASRLDGTLVVVRSAPWDPTKDGPAVVMPPSRQGGLGVLASQSQNGALIVQRVVSDMPAARAGIQPGDTLRLSEPAIGDVGSSLRLRWENSQGDQIIDLKRELFTDDPSAERTVLEDGSLLSTGGPMPGMVVL